MSPARDAEAAPPVEVPWSALEASTLRSVVEEFITREGTDYGYAATLETKVAEVLAQLKKGEAKLLWDPLSESCQLVTKQQLGPRAGGD